MEVLGLLRSEVQRIDAVRENPSRLPPTGKFNATDQIEIARCERRLFVYLWVYVSVSPPLMNQYSQI